MTVTGRERVTGHAFVLAARGRHRVPETIVFGATDDEVKWRPTLFAVFSLIRSAIGDMEGGHCCCTETHNRNLFEPKLWRYRFRVGRSSPGGTADVVG